MNTFNPLRPNAKPCRKGLQILTALATILMLFTSAAPAEAQSKLTAEQVAQKAAAVISGAKGVTATFTVTSNGHTIKGSVKSAGNKFNVTLPDVITWYNGKALYTLNKRIGETTVTVPTAQELLESNPLLYVKGGSAAYTCRFSTVKRTGKYVVELVPKKQNTGLRKLTFTINSSSFHTERIVVATSSTTATVDVTSFKTGTAAPASDFEYPKAKYPKAEIIDLR